MLEVIVNNTALNLPDDINIAMTVENPMMTEDKLPIPYSLSFEVGKTPSNLKTFGYPDRIGRHQGKNLFRSYPCKIFFQSICIFDGSLAVSSCEKTIKLAFKGVDFNENLKTPLFNKSIDTVEFQGAGNLINWDNPASFYYYYKAWTATLAYNTRTDYIAAPIHVSNWNNAFSWMRYKHPSLDIKTYGNDMLTETANEYLNMFNVESQDLNFKGEPTTVVNVPYTPQTTGLIFPMFKARYLVNRLIGEKLAQSAMDADIMDKVLIPTFYFPGIGRGTTSPLTTSAYLATPAYVTLSDYMPDVDANDFLKTIFNLFCMTLNAYQGRFHIVRNKDIINAPVKWNWSDCLIDQLQISAEDEKIYDYGYKDEKQYDDDDRLTSVATIADMVNRSFSLADHDSEYEAYFLITDTNQVFYKHAYYEKYRRGTQEDYELLVSYEFKGYKKTASTEVDSELSKYDAQSDIKQLYLQPAVYWTNLQTDVTAAKRYWVVPRWDHDGDLYDKSSRNKRQDHLSILLYNGPKPTISEPTKNYPFVSPYRNDDFSLKWEGDNGLINTFHKEFKAWIEKSKLRISGTFLLTPLQLRKINITDKVHVHGRNFYIEKLQYTIRKDRIDPVVADLIEC